MADEERGKVRAHLGRQINRLKSATQTAAGAAGKAAASAGRAASATRERAGTVKEVSVRGLNWAGEKTGSGYILFTLLLFVFEVWQWFRGADWFNGLNVELMMKNFSSISYIISGSLMNGLVIIVVLLYFFLRGTKVTKGEFVSFFIFVEVAYLCFLLHGPSFGAYIHIGLAVYTWFMLKGDSEDPATPSKVVALLLFLDFFGTGFIGWAGAKYGITALSVLGNRIVNPIWLLFALFYTSSRYKGKRPLLLNVLAGGVIVIYVLGFVGESVGYSDFSQGMSPEEIKQAKTFGRKVWDSGVNLIKEGVVSTATGTGGWWERLIMGGTGSYYGDPEGTEKVGIELEIEEPEAPVPTKTSFYAEISADTLGILDGLSVSAKCWWGETYETEKEGEITPGSNVYIYDGESETFRCKFQNLDLEADEIVFEAEASGLRSTGELPVFFMDEELRREMKRRDEDLFFGFYESKSRKPKITYTNGPLAIETTALNQPIGLGEDDVEKVFGIMLKNRWDNGEISRITSVKVELPNGVELSNCDYDFSLNAVGAYNIYSFDTSEFVPLEDIEEQAYFLCDMTIIESEKDDLISGPLKVHPRHFYINVEYDFKITDSISIEVIGAGEALEEEEREEEKDLAEPLAGVGESPKAPPVDCNSVDKPWLPHGLTYKSTYDPALKATMAEVYEGKIKSIPYNNPGETLKSLTETYAKQYNLEPAFLAAIETEESGMNLASRCALEYSRSALTGCNWPTSCADKCGCESKDTVSDGAQIKCVANLFRDAYDNAMNDPNSWHGKECNRYSDSQLKLWKCLLCLYVQGDSGKGDTECGGFSEKVLEFYCDWKAYYGG